MMAEYDEEKWSELHKVYLKCVNALGELMQIGYAPRAEVLRARKEIASLEKRVDRAEKALTGSGWTYKEGAEAWKPPLGRYERKMPEVKGD